MSEKTAEKSKKRTALGRKVELIFFPGIPNGEIKMAMDSLHTSIFLCFLKNFRNLLNGGSPCPKKWRVNRSNLLIKQGTKIKELTVRNEGLRRDNCRRRTFKNYARSGLEVRHSFVGQRKGKVI